MAIDNHLPYVEEFNQQAQALGIADRVEARVGDMHQLEFPPGWFDLIWCEGSIYVVGFGTGLRNWCHFLAPGGHIALTEVCWRMPDQPAECREFWAQEYPAVRDVSSRLETIADCGYELIGLAQVIRGAIAGDARECLAAPVRTGQPEHVDVVADTSRRVRDAQDRVRAFKPGALFAC